MKLFQFPARTDCNSLRCRASFGSTFFHFSYNIGAGDDMAEHNMFSVEPIRSVNQNKSQLIIFLSTLFVEENAKQITNATHLLVVRKNCDPFVFGPELAIDSVPKLPCFSVKFSSGNFLPYMDLPPVPLLFVKSPPWHIYVCVASTQFRRICKNCKNL